jgi:hypothetical protein
LINVSVVSELYIPCGSTGSLVYILWNHKEFKALILYYIFKNYSATFTIGNFICLLLLSSSSSSSLLSDLLFLHTVSYEESVLDPFGNYEES